MNDSRMLGILLPEDLGGGGGATPAPSLNELAISEDVLGASRVGRPVVEGT
jgi:hypothetical protein